MYVVRRSWHIPVPPLPPFYFWPRLGRLRLHRSRNISRRGDTISTTRMSNEPTTKVPTAERVDTNLEVIFIPASDVDRAKRFDQGLGRRLDADFRRATTGGGAVHTARLTVFHPVRQRIEARPRPARSQHCFSSSPTSRPHAPSSWVRGADVSDVFDVEGGLNFSATKGRAPGPDPQGRSYFSRDIQRSYGTAGGSRRSRRGSPDGASAWTWRR